LDRFAGLKLQSREQQTDIQTDRHTQTDHASLSVAMGCILGVRLKTAGDCSRPQERPQETTGELNIKYFGHCS